MVQIFSSRHCSYTRMEEEEEDPEERRRLQARFLIYKVLQEADRRQQRRASRRRACRYRRRIGLRLKRLRVIVSRAGACLCRQVMKQVKHLSPLLAAK